MRNQTKSRSMGTLVLSFLLLSAAPNEAVRKITERRTLVLSFLLLSAGCETMHNAGIPGFESFAKPDIEAQKAAAHHRDEYQQSHDHNSLYWLLAHKIASGMTLNEVEAAIGESGERELDTSRVAKGGSYQITDQVYKWGPDSSGFSVVLFFRDGRVYNFNPHDYKNP